jgi:hypothetical protein
MAATASSTDLSKLKARDLKKILTTRGVDYGGCVERIELVGLVIATAHLDVKSAVDAQTTARTAFQAYKA